MVQQKQAFTLIELLVVVLIIGILAAVALPQYQRAVEKARMAEAITLLSSMAQAEKIYFLANGEYTSNLRQLDVGIGEQEDETVFVGTHTSVQSWRTKTDHVIYGQPIKERIYWRFYYYLDEDNMYCGARETDTVGTSLCKSFGGIETIACGKNGRLTCYEVKL